MLKTFSLACLGLLLSSVLACAADDAPTGADSHGLEQSHRTAEGQSFEMQLHRDVTAETIIPAIIAAGHAELAALCSSSLVRSVRVLNPLASGSYEDVPCSVILGGKEGMMEANEPLTSEAAEPIGQTQQEIGPISLVACALGTIGTSLFTRYALCPHGTTARDRANCNDVGLWGGTGLTIVCTLPFLPIFF